MYEPQNAAERGSIKMIQSQQLAGTPSALVDQVADSIAKAILDGTFVSGQLLTAAEIAEWLGVSRTPVREAFMLLHAKRLLDKDPSRSFVVAGWNEDDLVELAQVRGALEALVMELVVPLLTPYDIDYLESIVMQMEGALGRGDTDRLVDLDLQLHSSLWKIAGNSRLQQLLEDLKIQVYYFMSVTRPADEMDYPASHRELISALQMGDVARAQGVIKEHIMSTAERSIARMATA
jgi:DNA-binding GntR family transcriptional regulator